MIFCACSEPCARYSAASRCALGLHAAEDLFGDLLRKIDAADARVDDLHAEFSRLAIRLLLDLHHQAGALVAHDLLLIGLAQHAAHGRVQHRAELVVGADDAVDGLIEAQRIDDAIADEAVDLEALIVGGEHFQIRALDIENAIVEDHDVFDQAES